ncbi:MAG: aryl-sulfate sulfotransferase [Candidatus Kapabacteria bacterium]|nr:aryl-sulfate sulfotransferase [Candidatus Kapabacteria bacterium]
MKFSLMPLLLVAASLVIFQPALAQQTVGLFSYNPASSYNGLTLFSPIPSKNTFLLDNCGREVHRWQSTYQPGHSVYLLNDGSILRAGLNKSAAFQQGAGGGGVVERIAWDGTVLWSYAIANDSLCQHHDIHPMPNGNVLMIVWEKKTNAELKAIGCTTTLAELFFERIMEVKPTGATTGDVVWQWRVWDHLVQETDSSKPFYGIVREHPELLNVNHIGGSQRLEFIHANGMDYNADLDQIVISCHVNNEIFIIDHSTTSAEAASHKGGRSGKGGDLLFRWGNPFIYGAGAESDFRLTKQHTPYWIPKGYPDAGKIMVFNNHALGNIQTNGRVSSVDIINAVPDATGNYPMQNGRFLPDSAEWRYFATPPTDFFSLNISGAQRLPNGNTLICSGARGIFFEINPAKETVWRYVNPVGVNGDPTKQGAMPTNNIVFRATRYGYDHPAFAGKTLVGGKPLELEPLASTCEVPTSVAEPTDASSSVTLSPNPASEELHLHRAPSQEQLVCFIVNTLGVQVQSFVVSGESAAYTITTSALPSGAYRLNAGSTSIPFLIVR